MENLQTPKARSAQLVVQELPDEVLLYDLEVDKAYCLNETARFVWKNCDGTKSVKDITKLAQNEFDSGSISEEFIWLAINELSDKSLLENKVSSTQITSRREAIRKIGLGAMVALPVISMLAVPQNALAATSCACNIAGNPCPVAGCPSGTCNGSACAP